MNRSLTFATAHPHPQKPLTSRATENHQDASGHYSSLDGSVLVLNRHYAPVHVIPVRRSLVLLYRDLVEVVSIDDGQYATHDFESWNLFSQMLHTTPDSHSPGHDHEWIQTARHPLLVPRIIRLLRYDRVPRISMRFNRRTLFARDDHRCQYCGRIFPLSQLSIDHVVPRSRGGETTWDNAVCCCLRCNNRKGDRTPAEAGLCLIRKPAAPRQSPLILGKLNNPRYRQWRLFLGEPEVWPETA